MSGRVPLALTFTTMQLQLNHIAAVMAVMLSATSCSDSKEETTLQPDAQGCALTFAAHNSSRSLIEKDGDLYAGGFAVWGEYVPMNKPGSPVNVFSATPVTHTDAGGWGYTDTRYWFVGQAYSFVALHPASVAAEARYEGGTTLGLTGYDVISGSHKGVDLLADVATRQCTDLGMGVVGFNFRHLLAQLNFVPRLNPAVTQTVVIDEASVYGIPSAGTWTGFSADGTFSWVADTGTGSMTTQGRPLGAISSAVSISNSDAEIKPLFTNANPLLCVPQAVPYEAVIRVTYHYADKPDNKITSVYNLQLASTTLLNGWEAGKSYRYTFEIGSNDFILFSEPEVVPWDEKGGSNIIIQGDETA